MQEGKEMPTLSISKSAAAPWTVKQFVGALGLTQPMRKGLIKVDKDGTVTVRDSKKKVAFERTLYSRKDLDALMKAIGKAVPDGQMRAPLLSDEKGAWDLYNSIRACRFENRVNSYWFRDQDDWASQLEDKYRKGRRFDLPLVELPADRVDIVTLDRKPRGLAKIEKYFDRGDTKYFPVHPQELKYLKRDGKADEHIKNVRCASSDRTLHTVLPGTRDFLLKVPLNKVVHDGIIRPISSTEATAALSMTEFLMNWSDKHKIKDDPFCFFPEAMAVVDKKSDSAAIVRMVETYPPRKNNEKTWTVCAFSLYATDPDFPKEPPMLQRMINSRPDKKQSKLDYFEENIMGPMTKSVFRVALDLGSSHVPHGQNLFLEIGENGQPTGRAPHSDLESFWPLPELAKPNKRKDYYKEYGYKYAKSKFEGKCWDTFRAYYLEGLLAPIIQCYIEQNPEDAAAVMQRAEKMMATEIQARQKLVNKFSKPGQPLRMFDRLGNGKYSLMNIIKWFMSEKSLEAIETEQAKLKASSSATPLPQTMSMLELRAANSAS